MARVVYLPYPPRRPSRAGPLAGLAFFIGLMLFAGHGLHQPKAAGGPAAAAGYVNPLAGARWVLDRTDQGVDYKPLAAAPVRAIGPGVVIASDAASGWPGGGWIAYRLTAGPARGRVVFVAEHLTRLLRPGARVWPGRPIATAHPGYPWTEWGWADCAGGGPLVRYGGAPDGTPMAGGVQFARFMRQLGAVPPANKNAENPGPGRAIPPPCTP